MYLFLQIARSYLRKRVKLVSQPEITAKLALIFKQGH